jgi:uncharacterized membrane protein
VKSLLLFAPALLIASPATARTESYRAIGTEPFWSLSIDRTSITFKPADGRAVTAPKPRPIVGISGESYRARGMTVDITHVRCSDGMSDRTYADTVKLTVGGRRLSGCGGPIVAADTLIANSSWRISAIDGRPVRLDRPATVGFTADRIQGSICNSFGGPYRFQRGTLTAGQVLSTQMACAGGASEVENAVFRALRQPLKVHRGNADTLVLSNGRTSITLRRAR